MARKGGDVTLSTFRFILAAMVADGVSVEDATKELYDLNDNEDGDSFDKLVKWAKEKEREASGWVAGKPGRRAEVNEAAIAAETLAKFTIKGAPMTLERLAALPDNDHLKVVLGKRIAEAVKERRAILRQEKANAEIAALAKAYAACETDSMPSAKTG